MGSRRETSISRDFSSSGASLILLIAPQTSFETEITVWMISIGSAIVIGSGVNGYGVIKEYGGSER